jgi:hypothetical protein
MRATKFRSKATAAIGGSAEAVRLALNSLEERGILRQITAGRYARTWAVDELFDILNEYEHSLATPTRISQPPRRAPKVSKGNHMIGEDLRGAGPLQQDGSTVAKG